MWQVVPARSFVLGSLLANALVVFRVFLCRYPSMFDRAFACTLQSEVPRATFF